MIEKTVRFTRRHWKLLLNMVTVLALGVLVYAIRGQFAETFKNLSKVNAWALLFLLPIQFLNYDAQTRLYQGIFKVVGSHLSYRPLFRLSLELNFVNHVFPSGGVTGISYFSVRMKSQGVTAARATAAHLFKLILYFLSFEILIVFAVFALAVQGRMSSIILLMASSLATLLVVGTAAFGFIVGSRERITGFFTYASRALNRLIRVVRPHYPETINVSRVQAVFEDLHENYQLMSHDWQKMRGPFLWALMANIWEVAAVYVVYIAFGSLVNVGAVILAYAVANFAGLISVLPGGVGVYEGLMTLILSATGVPSRLSLPVTVMYRMLSTLIQVPPGYYLYHLNLRTSAAQAAVIPPVKTVAGSSAAIKPTVGRKHPHE